MMNSVKSWFSSVFLVLNGIRNGRVSGGSQCFNPLPYAMRSLKV